ncbi:hypothetical protein GQ53DRAFT_650169 [Thozetella sp. PMI_491]|nr:hypothetical protein GQ53DRAFT_650169 [Thozetella sp. PMI_491]
MQCLFLWAVFAGTSQCIRLSEYVDPLIGTEGPTAGSAIAGGNAFPGAALPWGMVKAGIDTSFLGLRNLTSTDCNAGYTPLGNVTAVSLMHVSGTGGVPTYGLVSQMPLLGDLASINIADNNTYAQNRSLESETASVGYFSTTLVNKVKIEITAANHSAWIRYTYPKTARTSNGSIPFSAVASHYQSTEQEDDVHVLVDLTHVLPAHDGNAQTYGQKYSRGDLHVRLGSEQASYSGSATYTGGWSQPESHKIYFCGNFSVPEGSPLLPTNEYVQPVGQNRVDGAGTFSWQYDPIPWKTPTTKPKLRSDTDIQSTSGNKMGIGALFSWGRSAVADGDSVVETKIGISYVSAEQACRYIQNELPTELSFEDVVEQARMEWETKVLGAVEVVNDGSSTSSNDTLKRMLYTALYHSAILPTDKTGENPYWNSNESFPYYDDHYTLWDTYKTLLPMYHLFYTKTYSRVLKGLINIFTFEGYLPAGRAANWNGRVQGGTHADLVLGDAFAKSVRSFDGQMGALELGNIDWQEAFKAVIKDAEVLPERNADSVAFDGATKEGRGALDDYLSLGYITRNHSRSVSRGLEYSQDDFAVYSLAQGLNKTSVQVGRYRERSSWWENQWNPTANSSLGSYGVFTGFAGPRNADGGFNTTRYDPIVCNGGCSWSDDIYEAKVWETSFSAAPHDMSRLIQFMGGDEAFVKRLDVSFIPGLGSTVGENNDAGTALFNPGNEPSFSMPFLYNYVPGYHWKTVNQSRALVDTYFDDSRNGYPGNIDAGAIPSWLIFNLIGFYPIVGQPIYLLGAPRFSELKLKVFMGTEHERSVTIKATGLSDTSFYPQRVTLDGKALDRAWLSHVELTGASELVFQMGSEPVQWDNGTRPWSLSGW